MSAIEPALLYSQRVSHFTSLLENKKISINRVSTARLGMALVILLFIYFSFQNSFYLLPLFMTVAIFVVLVRWHSRLFYDKEHLEHLVEINRNEIASLKGDFGANLKGAEFLNTHHPYASDLDILGDGSVFQYLNRAQTSSGKELLAQRLLSPLSDTEQIVQTQQAIRELSVKLEFNQHIQATGMHVEDTKNDREQLRAWGKLPFIFYPRKRFRILLLLLPILTISAVMLAFISPLVKPVAILLVLAQWTITGFYLKRVSAFHDYVSRKKEVLGHYARMLKSINEQKFESKITLALQSSARQAEAKVSSLASLMSALDARLNIMTSLVVNALILYDLQCVYRLEKWKLENAANLENWLEAISSMEVLCSFAAYAFNNNAYCFASLTDKQVIHAIDLAHPLMGREERIANSITLGSPHSVFIVTGANMAGKSTFLRTLGVNLVLALNGAPVCASEFRCPIIELRTGMRTTDSLKDHQSYFYAELKRLKSIVEELESGKKLLILLDEILKGTNSTDKLTGSVALVKKLREHSCLSVIATHDLALGDMENEFPDQVINYHFEPTIENDQLSFDYKIKRGIAEKMNATFLMRKMGII